MDYRCPDSIRAELESPTRADNGRAKHFAWIQTLPLNRGDRVEIINENGEGYWWVYEPNN